MEGVALQMALAALPRRAGQRGPAGGAQPGMVVRDDELDPAHAAGDEAVEELAPVDLRLRERDGHPQHPPPADGRIVFVGHYADRLEDGGVSDDPVDAHLLVPGVENEILRLREPAGAPCLQFPVEPLGRVADLGGGHALDPHFRQHVLDVAGRDALEIHPGRDGRDRLSAASAALKRLRVEWRVAVAGGLGNAERGRPCGGVDALGLVAVGKGAAPFGALVVFGADEALALDLHARVVGCGEDREYGLRTVLDQQFHMQAFHATRLSVHVSSP